MTSDLDRVPVPTNGKGRRHDHEASPPAARPPDELSVTFTPTQIAVGFGIVASLLLLAARQLRRRGRGRR
jgi:hypothetical protein